MRLLLRALCTASAIAVSLLLFAACQLVEPGPPTLPLNTQALAIIVEQQDLAVRNGRAFRRAHGEPQDETWREAEARYRSAATAYQRLVHSVARGVAVGKPMADPAIGRHAAEAALRAKEFNTFAMQNTDPEHRSPGTGTVALASEEQLAELGREAWRSSMGRPRGERAAYAEGMRAAAHWPEWDTLK